MIEKDFKKINFPDAPGVYFFKGPKPQSEILYIGRATSLRDRVRSYFANDLMVTRGLFLVDMVTLAETIEFEETGSVLEAIILESVLIRRHTPRYNTKEKDNKSYNYVVITEEVFPRVILVRGRNLDKALAEDPSMLPYTVKKFFGPYPHGSLLREALKIIRKLFPFRDEKANNKGHETFYTTIGLAPNISNPDAEKEYQNTIRHLILFFEGKKKILIKQLEKEMQEYARQQQFEKAEKVKRTLYSLDHIQDIALIKEDVRDLEKMRGGDAVSTSTHEGSSEFRLEAYDIAHTSGKDVVGVMVVSDGYEFDKSQYRKFKISREENNDTAGIVELLTRRFSHAEWPLPQCIVIDGGINQKNAAEVTLSKLGLLIPVVSVVKDDTHNAREILGSMENFELYRKAIIALNAEAHRFAVHYHRARRGSSFFARKTLKKRRI